MKMKHIDKNSSILWRLKQSFKLFRLHNMRNISNTVLYGNEKLAIASTSWT